VFFDKYRYSVLKCSSYPAFNCTSTSTINAVLEAARTVNSPVIIQFSNGGAAFLAGKGIKNTKEKAAILGAIAGAQHVRLMAKHYNVPVVLHSDHCAKKLLPWFDGMLEADEEYFKVLKCRLLIPLNKVSENFLRLSRA
jgi:fructose-bisphosphate aldolase, class II